jgi:hypothetical protein
MFARAVVVVALLCFASPARADRAQLRAAYGEMQQRYIDVVRSHPEIYGNYPVVELVTMGVGSLIWERHGHIALCIRYQDPSQDTCYNYGIGDFHEPIKMAAGFFRGTNSFWVGPQEPMSMLGIYLYGDRTVWVQPLPLTDEQEKKVIEKLEYDIQDDHKYYAYDHFWDNCTTRVRDVLDNATGGALRAMKEPTDGRTYRDLAREGFFGMRVPLLITDIAMGRVTDRVPTYWERMFLPDFLREAAAKLWKIEPMVIYERKGPPKLEDGPSGRVLFALVVLLLTAPAWITRLTGRLQRLGMGISIVPPVLLGSILWFLAIISPLPYVHYNESCLVLLPTDLVLMFTRLKWRQAYARIRVGTIVLAALLFAVGVLTQPIWPLWLWVLVPNLVVAFWPANK